MSWNVYVAHLFGAALFANSLPHLIAGISGQRLPTPFASPPFKGLSSPAVNVVWALVNLAFAYVLLLRVGPLDLRNWIDAAISFIGFAAMALQCARVLGGHRKPGASLPRRAFNHGDIQGDESPVCIHDS
jgi:hypothetical protein